MSVPDFNPHVVVQGVGRTVHVVPAELIDGLIDGEVVLGESEDCNLLVRAIIRLWWLDQNRTPSSEVPE